MKDFKKLLKSLVLVCIYCFGLFVSLSAVSFSGKVTQNEINKEAAVYASTSKIINLHTQQSELAVSEVSEYSIPNLKLSYQDVNFDKSILNDCLLNAQFKQYSNHFTNLLIRHRKSNLIFPFHSFW